MKQGLLLVVVATAIGLATAQGVVKDDPVSKIRMPIGFEFTDMSAGANSKIFVVGTAGGRGELQEINTRKETRSLLKRFNRVLTTILYLPSKDWFVASEEKPNFVVMSREKGLTILERCRLPVVAPPTRMIVDDEVVYFGGKDKRFLYSIKVKKLLDCEIKATELTFIPKGREDKGTGQAYVQDVDSYKGLLILGVIKPTDTSVADSALYLYDPRKDKGVLLLKNDANLKYLTGIVRDGKTLYAAVKKGVANPTKNNENRISAWKLKGSSITTISASYLGRFQSGSAGSNFDALMFSKGRVCVSATLAGRAQIVCHPGDVFG
ncbi:hypothetical protein NDN08_005753 [Rhodosorus marinus]|uniref:Uncharacterized protein n=1 Tax=Rhodosorus marinus TaxID=101924 RepID=A0AAV8V5H6_9RHOD|nr:hypothetical protein NDN08_005753 [Rhodosorus marinus]